MGFKKAQNSTQTVRSEEKSVRNSLEQAGIHWKKWGLDEEAAVEPAFLTGIGLHGEDPRWSREIGEEGAQRGIVTGCYWSDLWLIEVVLSVQG